MSRAPRSRDLPGTRSNQLVGALHTLARDAGDHIVRYTPGRPDFWSGNGLVLDRPPCSPDDATERAQDAIAYWLARCEGTPELAEVARATLTWETLDPRPLPETWYPPGSSYTIDTVMRLARTPPSAPPTPGLVFRPALRDADWGAIAQLVVDHVRSTD